MHIILLWPFLFGVRAWHVNTNIVYTSAVIIKNLFAKLAFSCNECLNNPHSSNQSICKVANIR